MKLFHHFYYLPGNLIKSGVKPAFCEQNVEFQVNNKNGEKDSRQSFRTRQIPYPDQFSLISDLIFYCLEFDLNILKSQTEINRFFCRICGSNPHKKQNSFDYRNINTLNTISQPFLCDRGLQVVSKYQIKIFTIFLTLPPYLLTR